MGRQRVLAALGQGKAACLKWTGLCFTAHLYAPHSLPTPLKLANSGAELAELADKALLKKYLKITPEELTVGGLAEAQLMRIAARDC